MHTLADRLQLALERRPGATQAGLAAHCGVKPPSVSDWFTGETKSLKAASLRKAAEYLGCSRDWLETGLGPPGWVNSPVPSVDGATTTDGNPNTPPMLEGVAHEQTLMPFSVPPLRTEGEIMSGLSGTEYRFALLDDAMAPDYPRGLHVIFNVDRSLKPGRLVLIEDVAAHQLHVRQYAQGDAPGHWRGFPHATKERVFKTFDSARDNVKIVGVFKGTYETED